MAKNKKPKKRVSSRVLVSYASAARIFAPVMRAVDSLRGEVLMVGDVPMATDWEGDLVPLKELLIEWCRQLDRMGIPGVELHALAEKLDASLVVHERDLVAAEACVKVQLGAFLRMTVGAVRAGTIATQIEIEWARLEREKSQNFTEAVS